MFIYVSTWIASNDSRKDHGKKEIILHQSKDIAHYGYADSKRERRVWKDFRIQFLSEYHDLYV